RLMDIRDTGGSRRRTEPDAPVHGTDDVVPPVRRGQLLRFTLFTPHQLDRYSGRARAGTRQARGATARLPPKARGDELVTARTRHRGHRESAQSAVSIGLVRQAVRLFWQLVPAVRGHLVRRLHEGSR